MTGDERLHCPVCRARFRGTQECSRCGADLLPLMALAAKARELRGESREAFAAEDFSSARQFAAQAQELHLTARGRELLLLARWAEEFGAKTDFRRARDVTGQ